MKQRAVSDEMEVESVARLIAFIEMRVPESNVRRSLIRVSGAIAAKHPARSGELSFSFSHTRATGRVIATTLISPPSSLFAKATDLVLKIKSFTGSIDYC